MIILMSTVLFYFNMYVDNIKMDQPLDNQSLYKLGMQMESWLFHIAGVLIIRLVRWVLLALIRYRVESFCKIWAEYISTASIAFSVFWTSRDGSFQI